MTFFPSSMYFSMPFSAINVLPEPVGAVTKTFRPSNNDLIACF